MAKKVLNMNTVAVLMVLMCVIGFSQQQDDHAAFVQKMRSFRDECIKESGVDKDLPVKAFRDGTFTDDKNLKCYFKCLFQKMGRMDANGNMDLTTMGTHTPSNIDKAKAKEALDKCKDTKGADACETAFEFAKCMREAFGPIMHDN